MLTIVRSNRFLKDLRLAKKRGLDLTLLEEVVDKLANQEALDPKYHDHPLMNQHLLIYIQWTPYPFQILILIYTFLEFLL